MSFTSCVYSKCDKTSLETSMFSFPVKERGRLLLWIVNSGNTYLESLTDNELSRRYICAAHFPPSSIHIGAVRSRLIGPAIPIHFQSLNVPGTSSTKTHYMQTDDPSSPDVLKVKTPTKFYSKRKRTDSEEPKLASSSDQHSPTRRLSRKCLFEGPKKRLSRKCLFEQNTDDTPKRRHLKDTASNLLRKTYALRAQLRRLREKPKALNENEKYRSEVSKILSTMQLRKPEEKRQWSSAEKKFCLSFFYKSPAAYIYLRRQGVVLAAPSTIRRWLSKSNCLPGLSPDVFKQVNAIFEGESIKNKACVVCFDEMAIMTDLDYNKKNDFIEGFEDLGGLQRSNKAAKYALVFMARGLYSSWKLPLAYYLSHSNVSADNLELLLKSVIVKLFENGLLPKATVCDQASTNQKLYKSLGASKHSPFFFCKQRKIFALFDAPHLIKNVRNNLLSSNYTYKGKEISFNDVRKTYELDQRSTKSRALTKITERHINPNNFQKMNVSYATQIFSNSVASAIKTAKETGELTSESAEATSTFIESVNNMFDALNSKKQYTKNPHRHALSKKSTLVQKSITEAIELFEGLKKKLLKKYKSGKTDFLLCRPPCFDGIVQSCRAVMQIFEEESSEPFVFYLITSKLNQDVIENLFARFRQKSGSNRNPSARQLRTTFRSSLVNTLMKLPDSKNCEDENEAFIDITVEELPIEEKDDKTLLVQSAKTPNARCEDQNAQPGPSSSSVHAEYPALLDQTKITFEDCSVAYFAGYLAKKCIDKFGCHLCNAKLTKDIDLADESQLLILNKSYDFNKTMKLKMPSENCVKFIDAALTCYNVHFENLLHRLNIKSRLAKAIVDFLRCEAPALLEFSCEHHLIFMINHMILVKINFYCKNKKTSFSVHNKMHPKLRILKNK